MGKYIETTKKVKVPGQGTAMIGKYKIFGEDCYVIYPPFDLGDRNFVFDTEKGAKATLTRYINQFVAGRL